MGREVRRVPPNWEHPKRNYGNEYQPLHDRYYPFESSEWIKNFNEFEQKKALGTHDKDYEYYWEYDNPPDPDYCVPYTSEEATWFQVYETVSEGTPITPPFETEDELINYLVEKGDFWDKKGYSIEVATRFVKEVKWCMSGMFNTATGEYKSGINTVIP